MASHSSATPREEKSDITNASPKSNDSAKTNASPRINALPKIINASLKRRARLLVTNSSIPGQTRSLIHYALEIKDPYLAQVVRRVEAGEMVIDCFHVE